MNKRNDPKAKANYIKHCQILRNFTKETKNQHYSRLTAKSNNKKKQHGTIYRKRQGKDVQWNRFPPPNLWMIQNNKRTQ
jgi:hypothetical protein